MRRKILVGHDVAVAGWVGEQLGQVIVPPYTAMGVLDEHGTLIGGCVFSDFNGANVEVTIYGPRAMSRRSIQAAFAYAFNQLGCERISATVRRDNRDMRELMLRLGFIPEGMRRRYWGRSKATDAMLFGLLREHCKWIAPRENAKGT